MNPEQPVFLNGATPCFLVQSAILFTASVGILIEADYSVAAAGIATSVLGAAISLFIIYGVRRRRKPLTQVVALLAADLVLHLLLFGLGCWRVKVNYDEWRAYHWPSNSRRDEAANFLSDLMESVNSAGERKLYSVTMSRGYHIHVAFALSVLILILTFASFCFCAYLLHISIRQLDFIQRRAHSGGTCKATQISEHSLRLSAIFRPTLHSLCQKQP